MDGNEAAVQREALKFDIEFSKEGIAKLTDALAKAQLGFDAVLKQSENPAFRRGNYVSRYADLATVIDATQKPLAENGLVITQWPCVSLQDKSTLLVSLLAHSSGEWIKGTLTLPAATQGGFTAQSCGSSITYARRYSYMAIIGVAPEDDDGNAASGVEAQEAVKERKRQEARDYASKHDKTEKVAENTPAASGNGHPEGIPASEIPPANKGTLQKFAVVKTNIGKLTIDGKDAYAYGNHDAFTPDGTKKLFELLEQAASFGQHIEAEFTRKRKAGGELAYTETKKPIWEVKRIWKLGNYEWLEDGTPVLQRTREAGEDLFQ